MSRLHEMSPHLQRAFKVLIFFPRLGVFLGQVESGSAILVISGMLAREKKNKKCCSLAGNLIKSIENLQTNLLLEHLDLSANQETVIYIK
jgi:hypothetical protein